MTTFFVNITWKNILSQQMLFKQCRCKFFYLHQMYLSAILVLTILSNTIKPSFIIYQTPPASAISVTLANRRHRMFLITSIQTI